MKTLFLAAIGLLLLGCGAKPGSTAQGLGKSATTARPGAGAGSDAVTPIGPNIGGMTPVAGGDNLDSGTGGSLSQSAKAMAHKAASQSTAEPATTEGDP